MRLALFQPDIPQNTGTILRLCACFGIELDIIEPCGFAFSDAKMRRAGMDYIDLARYARHSSWNAFLEQKQGRLLLIETDGRHAYHSYDYRADDILLLGRESAGTPDYVYPACDGSVFIPQKAGRSLNVAMAGAIVLSHALDKTGLL